MENNEQKKVLLSVKDLEIKFRVRGRILTAIRGINLDIYENESIAIVGESGSGKSVFTKTFAGMLDDNGYISKGDIIFNDEVLSDTVAKKTKIYKFFFEPIIEKGIAKASKFRLSAKEYNELQQLIKEEKAKKTISIEEQEKYEKAINDLIFEKTEVFNIKQTYDSKNQKVEIEEANAKIKEYEARIKEIESERKAKIKEHEAEYKQNVEGIAAYKARKAELEAIIKEKRNGEISNEQIELNEKICREIYLSIGRYGFFSRFKFTYQLIKAFKDAFTIGEEIEHSAVYNAVFDKVVFRVKFLDETEDILHGRCVLNLSKIKYTKDWQQIRGTRVSTVFQDPMTSLNPILTIGNQISSIIMKHQHVGEEEARKRAIEMMKKVGIPNAENRYEDYPFQYSGGMRQRIVIAIALSCQPKILICDEPTTALDVTIQAQILKLIKDLQKEFGYTIVFITHDLGVVANVADRVAVLYAGQIVELGTCEDVFYDPRHPYTWALLSSLPQLAEKDGKLFSIAGTPPSLYNKIIGDPFAPRNTYCLKIDTIEEAPMFKVSDTHYAKTWLLDPRAPKVEKPAIIKDIHNKILSGYNIKEGE